ncbi:MAG TPA: hypothetical protein VNW06_03725 [Cytophagaceae bacterium]|jgi:hypothetical protein|nr:hypothetical protein [Cytophagaceae bacterium]
MKTEEIEEFADNNYEMTINQTTKLTLKEGAVIYGFFQRHNEDEMSETMKSKNKWDFVILPQDHIPPKATVINGDDVEVVELIEI